MKRYQISMGTLFVVLAIILAGCGVPSNVALESTIPPAPAESEETAEESTAETMEEDSSGDVVSQEAASEKSVPEDSPEGVALSSEDGEVASESLEIEAASRSVEDDYIQGESVLDLVGPYLVSGTGIEGNRYDGTMTIVKTGDTYEVSWTTSVGNYSGTGILLEDVLAVVYGEPDTCGLVTYGVWEEELRGYWTVLGMTHLGTEYLMPTTAGEGIVGTYYDQGTNLQGEPYEGTIEIAPFGDTYTVSWDTTVGVFDGTGILRNNVFAVVYGEIGACGVVAYQVIDDMTMEALWTVLGDTRLGTEVATFSVD